MFSVLFSLCPSWAASIYRRRRRRAYAGRLCQIVSKCYYRFIGIARVYDYRCAVGANGRGLCEFCTFPTCHRLFARLWVARQLAVWAQFFDKIVVVTRNVFSGFIFISSVYFKELHGRLHVGLEGPRIRLAHRLAHRRFARQLDRSFFGVVGLKGPDGVHDVDVFVCLLYSARKKNCPDECLNWLRHFFDSASRNAGTPWAPSCLLRDHRRNPAATVSSSSEGSFLQGLFCRVLQNDSSAPKRRAPPFSLGHLSSAAAWGAVLAARGAMHPLHLPEQVLHVREAR